MRATTLTDRAVVRLSGEGVRAFFQGLVTSDVEGPLPVWAGLLTPQGKCLFDFVVWGDDEDLLLDCEAEAADDLIKRLSIYRLRRAIVIERDPELAVHWSADGGNGVADPRLAALGHRWLGPAELPASGWLERRLSLGVTEGRAELGDILWLECNAVELNGVSFSKGCFVGQENTARMNWRSKVNRRLVVVETAEQGQLLA
jgi:folate-binding protein YgfZ